MKCEYIKELILTEYLDNQMDKAKRELLEEHISSCLECKEFLSVAKNTVIEPFKKAENINISQESVWEKLQNAIEMDKKERFLINPFLEFFERLKSFVYWPRPAFAMASLAVLLIMVIIIKQVPLFDQQTKVYNNEEIEYYASLSNSWDDDSGFNTDVENFLL